MYVFARYEQNMTQQEQAMTNISIHRFVECENWRKSFGGGVDHLVPTFDYKEKADVFHYYPQYYHKTDKVCQR